MKPYFAFTIACLLISAFSFSQPTNTISEKEIKDGWKLLFDGKTLNGWHTYDKSYTGTEWEVRDGCIHLTDRTKPGFVVNDLTTNDAFDDFDLTLDWKISENGNSGIMFMVQEDPSNYQPPYFTGPEMQVLDNNGNLSYTDIPEQKAGAMYGIMGSSQQTSKPAGEWNSVEIICKDDVVTFYQNGVQVVMVGITGFDWIYLVSKGYGTKRQKLANYRRGKIDLQDAGDEVWYRNIKIRPLDNVPAAQAMPSSNNNTSDTKPQNNDAITRRFYSVAGTWRITNLPSNLQQVPVFKNEYLEMHKNFVCISRNQENNSGNNIAFFKWDSDLDSLYLYTRTYSFHCLFTVNNKTAELKAVLNGTPIKIELQKVNDEPLSDYNNYLTADHIRGNWRRFIQVSQNGMSEPNEYYYDIHPSNDNFGEIVMYAPRMTTDSLLFVKYNYQENPEKNSAQNPVAQLLGTLVNSDINKDTNQHYYTYSFLNAKDDEISAENVDCWYRDGLLIINEMNTRFYFVKAGENKYANMRSLHNQYNIAVGRTVLPPYGAHWQNCFQCGGSGEIVSGYEDVYDHTNSNGYAVYNKKEIKSTCTECNGSGGFYVDDITGEKGYTDSVPYPDIVAYTAGSSPVLQRGLMR